MTQRIQWCEQCRARTGHEAWCPILVADADPNRPPQPIATEDWARGVLAALAIEATDARVAIVRDALVALHRRANDEGFGWAKDAAVGFVPTASIAAAALEAPSGKVRLLVPSTDDAVDVHAEVAAAMAEHLDGLHAQVQAVGVDQA